MKLPLLAAKQPRSDRHCVSLNLNAIYIKHVIKGAAARTTRVTTLIVRVSPRLPKSFSVPAKNAGPVCPITPLSWADLVDCDSASSAMLVQTDSIPVAVRGKTALRRVLHRPPDAAARHDQLRHAGRRGGVAPAALRLQLRPSTRGSFAARLPGGVRGAAGAFAL